MIENDHDILITLVEQVRGIRNDIAELRDTTKTRVDDHEGRIRFLEKYVWAGLTIVGFLAFLMPYIWNQLHK